MSKMLKELILDRDEVCLPGVGSFVTEIVPAAFSDKGYTINPPYRRLFFRQRNLEGDDSLARLYALSNAVELPDADRIIRDFLAEMKEVLKQKKTLVFPELGRLRATKENNFFFIPDEDIDIWPSGFGLEPVSLKTHQELDTDVSATLDGLKELIAVPANVQERPEETPEEADDDTAEKSQETAIRPEPAREKDEKPAEPIIEEPMAPENELAPDPACEKDEKPVSEPISEPMAEQANVAEPTKEASETAAPEPTATVPATGKLFSGWMITLICVLALAVIGISVFFALAKFRPDILDTILYNKEELEILRHFQ